MTRLRDQVVVITGAGNGLGREMARQFAARGAKLVLADENEVALPELVTELVDQEVRVAQRVTDMADATQVDALAELAVSRFGQIDCWINNAAVSVYGDFLTVPPEEFRRVIEVNLFGYAQGLRTAAAHMGARGGTIICITSNVVFRAIPLQAAYCASKAAIAALVDATRVELRRAGIPIALCQVMPVGIDTPMFNESRSRTGFHPRPTGQILDPSRVAAAVVRCAEHPQREVPVGSQAALLKWANALFPALVDRYMAAITYPDQMTDEPMSPDVPSDLFGSPHLPGRTRGGWPGSRSSPYTWVKQHRGLVWGGAAVAALAWSRWRLGRRDATAG